MIKFRQKVFFWPAALMVGTTGLSMAQASSQAKESEEQAEETQELMRAQNKKLDKIAKAAQSNPQAAADAAQVLKQYSAVPMGVMRTLVRGRQALRGAVAAGEKAIGPKATDAIKAVGSAGKDA